MASLPPLTSSSTTADHLHSSLPPPNPPPAPPSQAVDLLEAIAVVERDSAAVAESFTSLFASLRSALSEVTGTSIEHIQCLSDAAGRLQESAIEAAGRGNRFINSCIRLNEEMKGVDKLAKQLKVLRKNVDTLDAAVNRLLRVSY
ncbi:hypothetical protein Droror1_Dr00024946 [Drosera rotundifolia]